MRFSDPFRGPVPARIFFVLVVLKLGAPPTVFAAEGTVRIIATSGDPAPDGNGSLASFFLPFLRQPIAVNRSGQVAFPASLTGTSGGSTDNFGLFVGDGSSIRQIARKGDTLPYGDDKLLFFTSLSRIDGLSDAGEVAFHSNLSDASGNSLDEIALLRSDGAGLRVIAR